MTKKARRASALGEVTAVRGFVKQYEYSACAIYDLMQAGKLDWISICDPNAGILDDLLVSTRGQIIATQVKSQSDVKPVSLRTELITNKLSKDIADAWISLEALHGKNNVCARFVFGGYFSTSDKSLKNTSAPGKATSAEFVRLINKSNFTTETINESDWSEKLAELQGICKLKDKDFPRFLNCLELYDCRELTRRCIDSYAPSERPRIQKIKDLLPNLIAKYDPGTKLSETEIVEELGWRSKLSQRNFHGFPVPDDFQENIESQNDLDAAIRKYQSGYIALLGPPGSGKSTLLQRSVFSNADYGVARYLAFLPDQRHGLGRAEAGEFLNDLTAALSEIGFTGSRFRSDFLRDLRDELKCQIDEAHQRYIESGRKTVVVIDGLDHVPREETPESSFIKELPPSNSLPAGVIFVLGSQHLDLTDLNARAKQQAKEDGRCIKISALSKDSIYALADKANLPEFVDRELLYESTDGHPLSARYFLEALKTVSDELSAEKVLSYDDGLGRSLEEIYERVWNALGAKSEARHVLGLLARAEGEISAAQLAKAVSDDAVEDVISKAAFLLARDSSNYFSIFHNSFRLFVARETAKRFGQYDADIECKLNRELAEISALAPPDDPQFWMELRYRARSGDSGLVLDIGTPEYFRRSLIAYRPSSEIYIDLRLVYSAVKSTRDRVRLLNKLLIAKEIEYRLEAVSQTDFVEVFLELGDRDLAIKHALDGPTGEGWLDLVDDLWNGEKFSVARRVFEANEPLEALFGNDGLDIHQDEQLAHEWIHRAHRFRPVEKLITIIETLPIQTRFGNAGEVEQIRRNLLFSLASGLILDHPDTDISQLCTQLGLTEMDTLCLEIEAAQQAWDVGDVARCGERISSATGNDDIEGLSEEWRRLALELAYASELHDTARSLLSNIEVRSILDKPTSFEQKDFGNDCQRFYRLCWLTDVLNVSPKRQSAEDHEFFLLVEARLTELAKLRSDAERRNSFFGSAKLRTIIHFLAHARPDHHDAYKFNGVVDWFADEILRVAHRFGDEQFRQVVDLIDEKISQNGNNLSNSHSVRLRIATTVFDLDNDQEKAAQRVRNANALSRSGRTPHEIVENQVAIARAFATVGLREEAEACLNRMHEDTFGYWLRAKKEPQYEFWAWSFRHACDSKPENAGGYARDFGQFILGMDETEGDDTAQRVISDLLYGAGYSPAVAAGLFDRLVESDLITWGHLAGSVIAGIMRHDPKLFEPCIEACCRLVLPFFNGDDRGLIKTALSATDEQDQDSAIDSILNAIKRWSPQSHRAALIERIREVAPNHGPALDAEIEEARQLLEHLNRTSYGAASDSGNVVSLDIDASSFDELVSHGEGTDRYGDGIDHSYARAAESLARNATRSEIESFIAQRPHVLRDAKFAIQCSRTMWRSGDKSYSDELFEKAEAAAHSGHWSWFLGGEKLGIHELRVEREGDVGREIVFDRLVGELASGQTSGVWLFLNLDEVFDLICLDKPYGEFWQEVAEHLKQYREFRLGKTVAEEPSVQTNADLLAYVLARAFSFPVPKILQHARATALAIASQNEGAPVLRALLTFLEIQPNGMREAATLVYRSRHYHHLDKILIDAATRYTEEKDFVIANQAVRVLKELKQDFDDTENIKDLPAFYKLQTTGSAQASNFDLPPGIAPGSRSVWSDDPWTWTSGFEFQFNVISGASGVSIELLRRRCAEFMRIEGGHEAFGPEAEEQLRIRLAQLNLKFQYFRLLPFATKRGIGKVLGELVDADAVDPRVLPAVWSRIGGPSLAGYDLPIEAKPLWFVYSDVPSEQHGGVDRETWLEAISDDLYLPLVESHTIFAEKTTYRTRIRRNVIESIRCSFPAEVDLDNVSIHLYELPHLISLDDLRPRYEEEESRLISIIPADLFGDLENATITLCPYVLAKLGWMRDPVNPLEILNANGQVIAWTIRWVDGCDRADIFDSVAFGEGQALLLTDEARVAIESTYGSIEIGTLVHRTYQHENDCTDTVIG